MRTTKNTKVNYTVRQLKLPLEIEKSCKNDVRYLLDGMQAPSFATFGNIIRKQLADSMDQIFMDINANIFEKDQEVYAIDYVSELLEMYKKGTGFNESTFDCVHGAKTRLHGNGQNRHFAGTGHSYFEPVLQPLCATLCSCKAAFFCTLCASSRSVF